MISWNLLTTAKDMLLKLYYECSEEQRLSWWWTVWLYPSLWDQQVSQVTFWTGKGPEDTEKREKGKNREKGGKKTPWAFPYWYLDQLLSQTQKSLAGGYSSPALGSEDLTGWPWVVWFCPALIQGVNSTSGLGMGGSVSTSNFFLSPAAAKWKTTQIFIPGNEEDSRGMQHGSGWHRAGRLSWCYQNTGT